MSDRITTNELAEEWRTTRHQLDRYRALDEDPLPYEQERLGNTRIFFKRAEVEAWAKRNLPQVLR